MPRYSLKTLLVLTFIVAALATFYYIRSQPRVVAQRFQKLIEQGDHQAALQMIDPASLHPKRKIEPHERLEVQFFWYEEPNLIDWLQGVHVGTLDIYLIGNSQTASVITPLHCDVVITRTDVQVMRTLEAEPMVAMYPNPDQ